MMDNMSGLETQAKRTGKKLSRFRAFLLLGLSSAMKWGLISCLILAFGFGGVNFVFLLRPYGFFLTLTIGLIFVVAVLVISTISTLLFVAFKRLRWQTFLVVFASLLLCAMLMPMLLYVFPLMIFLVISVYLIFMCATKQYKDLSKPKKLLRYILIGVTSAVTILLLIIIFWPGPTSNRPDTARLALPHAHTVQTSSFAHLSNPSVPGGYNFSVYYYASSEQRNDPFPAHSVLPSSTADASDLLESWGRIREWQLGFGANSLPLNAQIWMPDGAGMFPIALIVHGNHTAGVRSDQGYAYLGELLASQGIIAVSVDQTFLNTSPVYNALLLSALENENGVRAFVLLEHLLQWYEWNADSSHPFFGRVDFERIALIGHSRGGEAAALAAAFVDLGHYPGNGRVVFDYPFSINTVIAIAPAHRQYDPAGLEVSLAGVNYLVIHGGHDKDVFGFMGADMYSRVDVSEYGIKARVWIQHANHGQFNSVWGRNDLMGIWNMITNRRMLMSLEEQQTAAKVFISAFLEATLHGRSEYTSLFKYFANGEEWLPPTLYITSFADSEVTLLDNFDSGFNLGISTSGLVTYSSQGFDRWTITELPGKLDNNNRVLKLQWGNEETPIFRVDFAEDTFFMGDRLYISLGSGNEHDNEPDVSFYIRLTDSNGHTSIKHINDFGGVVNPIDTPIFTPIYLSFIGMREPVLQMVIIPTEQFEGLQGGIVSMEWVMDSLVTIGAGQTLFADDLRIGRISNLCFH